MAKSKSKAGKISIDGLRTLINKTSGVEVAHNLKEANPTEVKEFLDFSLKKYNISFDGLMCLPPISRDPKIYFDQLKDLSNSHKIEKLSMGMSGDYLSALDSGATHIRIGSLIFGERV